MLNTVSDRHRPFTDDDRARTANWRAIGVRPLDFALVLIFLFATSFLVELASVR